MTTSPLANPTATRELLEEFGLATKHRLGQNFLIDNHVIERICELSELAGDERVLEVGPGVGTLTLALLQEAACVTSIEADPELEPVLDAHAADYANFRFIMGDALKVTPEQIEQAARIANAHEFIMQTEQGYDTNIGDRGGRLSGGQRQRVSIARAILKNPPILILDEATSALDTESERLVQDALERLMKSRTTVAIAHRLSTIKNADEICVMHEGEIVERGTHEELIALGGYYKKLHEMQK